MGTKSLSSNVKMVSLKNLPIFVKCKMVRHYIRKTERCMYPNGYILKAVKKVVAEKKNLCDVSKGTSTPKRFLLRYVKDFLAAGIQYEAEATTIIGGYQKPRKVNPLISFTVYVLQCELFLVRSRFSAANKKAILAITSKGPVTFIMESLPQT